MTAVKAARMMEIDFFPRSNNHDAHSTYSHYHRTMVNFSTPIKKSADLMIDDGDFDDNHLYSCTPTKTLSFSNKKDSNKKEDSLYHQEAVPQGPKKKVRPLAASYRSQKTRTTRAAKRAEDNATTGEVAKTSSPVMESYDMTDREDNGVSDSEDECKSNKRVSYGLGECV